METKHRTKQPRLVDLIPEEAKLIEIVSRLYNGDPAVGDGGPFTDLLQAHVNAALEGDMDYYLQEVKTENRDDRRNGHTHKLVKSRVDPIAVNTPRDRDGDHEYQLIKKWGLELGTGLDDAILSLYARGQLE